MKSISKIIGFAAFILMLATIMIFSVCSENIVEGGIPCNCGGNHYMVSWTLDDKGNLDIQQNVKPSDCSTTYYQFAIGGTGYGQWGEFVNAHKDDVEHATVGKINKIQFNGSSTYSLFGGMTNLKTVRFAAGQEIKRNGGKGIFEDCTNLESVTFGSDKFVPGLIDLSGAVITNDFAVYTFKNCEKIKRVVIPESVSEIGTEMFMFLAGKNSALTEVVCLGNITNIGSQAFRRCVSLTSLEFQNSDFTVSEKAFDNPHNCDLKVIFADGEKTLPGGFPTTAKVVNATAIYYGGDSELPSGLERSLYHVGFSVRLKSYDGLRSIFAHDNETLNDGYTLKEYGVIALAKKNMDKLSAIYSDACGIMFNKETMSVTLEQNGEIVSGSKFLSLSGLKESEKLPFISDGTYFALSIVNYGDDAEKIKSGVYLAGYEVYADSDGAYVIVLTDSSTESGSSDFVSPGYYDVALGMYKSGVLNSSKDDDSIVWDDLCTAGAVTLSAGKDYLNAVDITKDIFTLEDPMDLDGNAFGDTFTLKEVPIVKCKVTDKVLDLTEKSGITYTILRDGAGYTLIYRPEEGKSGLTLPSITVYDDEPMNHQFIGQKWYGQLWSADAPNGYSSVSAKRPQPLLLSEAFRTEVKTIIFDKGIVGAEGDAFFRLGANFYVASEDFKTLSGNPFRNAEGLTTFTSAPYAPKENTVDLSHLTSVGTLNFSSNSGVKATKVIIPSNAAVPTSVNAKGILFISDNNVYIPSSYNGNALSELKTDDYSFYFYDAENGAWIEKVYNSETDTFEEKITDAEGNYMKLVNERKAGYGVTTDKIYDNSKNWEINIYGTLKNSQIINDTDVSISVGGESFTIALDASLRCELLAAAGSNNAGVVQRYTQREHFTYCPSSNVAYVSDYISIKCKNGEVSASLYTFDASSTYANNTYNTITYTESSLTMSNHIAGSALKSNATVTNSNGFYMDVIYASALPELEKIEFEVTKALTEKNSGVNSIARNIYITEDGKVAYLCTNNSWQENSNGAWLLEIKDFDTETPIVERKVLLNDLGKCTDLVAAGLLDENCHGPNCPGITLSTMGRACTGVTEAGDYIYAVERYTGAFDMEQRLTNRGAEGDTEMDDGFHGHGISYLCVIRKSDFMIVNQIPLKNNATSIEINKYDGKLYVMEMTRNWSVYGIEDKANPVLLHSFSQYGEFGGVDTAKVAAYSLGDDYIEYQRATFWTDGNGKNYIAMSAFSGGFTIWDITDIENRIPTRVAHFSIREFGGQYGRHVFDVAISYPYLYITVGGTVNNRFSDGNLPDGIITLDVSDPAKVGVDNSVATVSGIPFEDESDRIDEGDPAPSRIIVVDDVVMVNYSDKGVAFFRIGEDGIPVYDRCESFTGGIPQTMKLNPATGGIVITNGEGSLKVPGVYEIKIKK